MKLTFSHVLLFPALASQVVLGLWLPSSPALVVGTNLGAFLLFGWDKTLSKAGGMRVPELVLHALALSGAGGAVAGRLFFKHKTLHPAFSAVHLISVALGFGAPWLFAGL